jgi:hypothetical protein
VKRHAGSVVACFSFVDDLPDGTGKITMWIRLDDAERTQLLALAPDGPLAKKLREAPDEDASAFMDAVEVDDELEMDPDATVSRGENGAFVMTWSWVSNEKAGLQCPGEDDSIGLPFL